MVSCSEFRSPQRGKPGEPSTLHSLVRRDWLAGTTGPSLLKPGVRLNGAITFRPGALSVVGEESKEGNSKEELKQHDGGTAELADLFLSGGS